MSNKREAHERVWLFAKVVHARNCVQVRGTVNVEVGSVGFPMLQVILRIRGLYKWALTRKMTCKIRTLCLYLTLQGGA